MRAEALDLLAMNATVMVLRALTGHRASLALDGRSKSAELRELAEAIMAKWNLAVERRLSRVISRSSHRRALTVCKAAY